MTVLFVARHAPAKVEGVCYGRSDVEVRVEAADARGVLVDALTDPPALVWSSPSARCRTVAEGIATHFRAGFRVDSDLFELDFGAWESRPWSSIATDDRDAYERWAAAWETLAPPGGERVIDLEQRVRRWLASLEPAIPHALIAHAGVVRALEVIVRRRTWPSAMRTPVDHLEWKQYSLDSR